MVIPLCNMIPGGTARILCLPDWEAETGRLYDLGFVPGAQVSCVLKKRNGQTAALLIRGAVIALRKENSQFILAEELS